MRCHEGCAKTKAKLTSPLERERGSGNRSQAVPRLLQGGGVTARAGGSGLSARLLLSPGTCRASHKLPWAGACEGAAVAAQPGGTAGVTHVLGALSGCSGVAGALQDPSAPMGGAFGVSSITWDLQDFGVIRGLLWCEG